MKIRFNHIVLFAALIVLNITVFIPSVLAQGKQGYQWCWGKNAGLDFNTFPPSTFVNSINTNEAASSVADEFGNLLFYTNGVEVWDKSGAIMPNGTGLQGHFSATQGVVISPVPGNCHQYYIFTVTANEQYPNPTGLNYVLVDLTLQGNGSSTCPLGDVVPGSTVHLTQAPLTDSITEAITTVMKPNNIDYWVIVKTRFTNSYYAFEVSSLGVNPVPVISVSTITGINFGLHFLKPSKDGLNIVDAYIWTALPPFPSGFGRLLYFDFDSNTGILSNAEVISSPATTNAGSFYEAAFSSDDNYIYVGFANSPQTNINILRYDRNAAIISASETFLLTLPIPSTPAIAMRLKIGPDCKIYAFESIHSLSNPVSNIHVINDPNSLVAPNITTNAITFPPPVNNYASATTIFHGYEKLFCSNSTILFTDTIICPTDTIPIGSSTLPLCYSYVWQPSIGLTNPNNPFTLASPDVTTTYTLKAINVNCDTTEIGTTTITVIGNSPSINPIGSLCLADSPVTLTSLPSGGIWSATCGACINSSTGLFDPSLAGNGNHTITYQTTGACQGTDNLLLVVHANPDVNIISSDVLTCLQTNVQLNGSSINAGATANWQGPGIISGATTFLATVNAAGTYILTVTDSISGCTNEESIVVTSNTIPPDANAGNNATLTCTQNNAILNGSSTTVGSTAFWSGPGIVSGGNTFSPTVNLPGTYTLVVTDPNNGCIDSATVLVNTVGIPSINLSAQTSVSCYGGSDALATVFASGGTGALTISWNTNPVQIGVTANNLSAGSYVATVTDQDNCTATLTITITEPDSMSVSITNTSAICLSSNGTATVSVSGGVGPYSYSWNTIPVQNTTTALGLESGLYTVTIQDANGCIATQNTMVNLLSNSAVVIASPSESYIYSGESVALSASGGVVYNWSPPNGLSCTTCPNPTATPLENTTYVVSVVDSNGCVGSDTVRVYILKRCSVLTDEILVANVFSPNNDGVHDMLFPEVEQISELEWRIFNRWGEQVFFTNEIGVGWDGTQNGKPLGEGVFVYYLSATCPTGEKIMIKGNITLLK